MLVKVEKIAAGPGGSTLAQVRTAVGSTVVRWCGDPGADPGEYHVEWTVDEDITWGLNARPAVEAGPEISPGGHCVVLRGRLSVQGDLAASLHMSGTAVLLDLSGPLPDGVADTRVELRIDREKVALYPYLL